LNSNKPEFRFFQQDIFSHNQVIEHSRIELTRAHVQIKREDLIHPFVSGNKFRKLKYPIRDAIASGHKTLLTYGGAYSNHIAAVAEAGRLCKLETIGIIRGEELRSSWSANPTLRFAHTCGMKFKFVSRSEYKFKEQREFGAKLFDEFGDFYEIPEGGTSSLAVKGCAEILASGDDKYEYICAPVGTGGTLAGIINASKANQKVIGFSVLKGSFLHSEVRKYTEKTNFEITDSYCFGGYAKIDSQLIRFINDFKEETNIQLDPVYTGKMMFGIFELLNQGYFSKNSRILAIHTGGIQGIRGMNQKLKKKNLPQIIT
jgi:1-aminocyclopropane-1-carboxylate deaminase